MGCVPFSILGHCHQPEFLSSFEPQAFLLTSFLPMDSLLFFLPWVASLGIGWARKICWREGAKALKALRVQAEHLKMAHWADFGMVTQWPNSRGVTKEQQSLIEHASFGKSCWGRVVSPASLSDLTFSTILATRAAC